ncbi:23S rRNA (Uracil-5-) -methyltransferase RumA [hydrothermal vent metagenome]|uniref:23S rRNA (Uracil-5-) -methyltransferase RumA n=1 Tax=hydrothermal vent metagenome TaxID=652676 RepID=A0A3B0TSN8_9ZZZZ
MTSVAKTGMVAYPGPMARRTDRRRRRGKTGEKRHGAPGLRPAPVRKTVKIERLGRHGVGIAEDHGGRVYVPYTLPGEEVVVRISGERGIPLEILSPSPDRTEPFCPHFTACGGCALQHAKAGFVAAWKRRIIVTALENRGLNADVAPVINAHGAGRRRVTLHVRRDGGKFLAGFMRPRTHRLEPIEACPVLVPALGQAPELAKALTGPLSAHANAFDVAMTATDSGLDVAIFGPGRRVANAADDLDVRLALVDLAARHDLARLALGDEILAARRPATLTMGPARVELPPAAFLQATSPGEETIAGLAVQAVGSARRIADLFAGLGPFALRLGHKAAVRGIDSDGAALKALAAAANAIGIRSCTTEVRDLFRRPLLADDLAPYDAVIFDPPRAGAQAQAQALGASPVPVVVAVSCEPASFARDAGALVAGGYRLDAVTPVDQFKASPHIEIVGIFRR